MLLSTSQAVYLHVQVFIFKVFKSAENALMKVLFLSSLRPCIFTVDPKMNPILADGTCPD